MHFEDYTARGRMTTEVILDNFRNCCCTQGTQPCIFLNNIIPEEPRVLQSLKPEYRVQSAGQTQTLVSIQNLLPRFLMAHP